MHNGGSGDGGEAGGLIEVSAAVAGTEIGCQDLGLRVVLNEKADRDAAVGPAVPDFGKPLPGRERLSAVDPLNQHQRGSFGGVHAASTFGSRLQVPEMLPEKCLNTLRRSARIFRKAVTMA
jgi:hypothetical protein